MDTMSIALQNKITMTETGKEWDTGSGSILKVLAYFDIFQYPLTKDEIKQFLDKPVADHALERLLKDLIADGFIFLHHQFYSLHDNPLLACRRIKGNAEAERLLSKAYRIGRFLYRFPFVRGIGISGSLSKNFADEKTDIDFFIITQANRLWIARTLMHLFKKLTFLAGRQHYYCMNYYIDEEALLVHEKNIFTAIEIKTLLPVSGGQAFGQFFAANQWTHHWLPACGFRQQVKGDPHPSFFKRFGEWLGNGRPGDAIDNYLMRVTDRRWKRKEKTGKRNKKGQPMGLATGKHYARSNPGNFREKVLSLFEEKLIALKLKKVS
jgi:hypothetical protein